ncbi:MAG: PUA domain-containing protein [Bacilli bacterium]
MRRLYSERGKRGFALPNLCGGKSWHCIYRQRRVRKLAETLAGAFRKNNRQNFVDEGAAEAIHNKGSSLFCRRQDISGKFSKGDLEIVDVSKGYVVARGLAAENSDNIKDGFCGRVESADIRMSSYIETIWL